MNDLEQSAKAFWARHIWRSIRTLAGLTRGSAAGQSAVECAVVLPVLLMMLFGMFELGRAAWTYEAVGSAAKEGARYAGLHGINSPSPVGPGAASFSAPNSDSTITTIVQNQLAGLNSASLTVLSTWPDGNSVRGSRAIVEARYVFETVAGSFINMPTFTMSSAATTRVQY